MRRFLGFLTASYVGLLNYLANRKCIYVLTYHRISDQFPPNELVIPPRQFREQMAYLKKYCHVVGIEKLCDMIAFRKRIEPQRKPQVVITIDDGYRDTFFNAFPILKGFNISAAAFLATGFIGTDKKMSRYEQAPSPDMMSWEEVEEMQKAGNTTFGPHTVSHPHLPTLDYAAQKAEIEESIKTVYAHTGQEISKQVFCYTYGEYNEDTLKILKELGIKISLTVKPGANNARTNPLELKRIVVDGRYGAMNFIMNFCPAIWEGLN